MIELNLSGDPAQIKTYADRLHVSYREGLFVYIAKSGGEELGFCLFENTAAGIYILEAKTNNDDSLFDGLVRAAMAVLIGKEKDLVEFSGKIDQNLLNQFGFSNRENRTIQSANQFFSSHKNCKK